MIAYLDFVAGIFVLLALIILMIYKFPKRLADLKLLFIVLLLLHLIYFAAMYIEWYGISSALERYEDLTGALIPMFWAFLFYIERRNS